MRRRIVCAELVLLIGLTACAGGPPRHTSRPAEPYERPGPPASDDLEGGGVPVRVGLHWEPGTFEIWSQTGLRMMSAKRDWDASGNKRFRISSAGLGQVKIVDDKGRAVREPGPIRFESTGTGHLVAGGRAVRGRLEVTAQSDSVIVVNVLPLEDYLRGVVPREIGPRPREERDAVAAQAIAARTYTIKRLGQYTGVPFDMFASVQDQVYEGIEGENAIANDAIQGTRGLVLVDGGSLIEAYYASTCGGTRSDIAAVWPHREALECLRGGPDGDHGREWCRESRHFTWQESWSGRALSGLVREHLPGVLELPKGRVKGDLVDVRIVDKGPSGRASAIEYVMTDGGIWTVPGDKNRWILRRDGGGILRSVFVDLRVQYHRGKVKSVVAEGRGNGHGVGMCQIGAVARARMGHDFHAILASYYPGAEIRPIRDDDLPDDLAVVW